jgi:hypothetical protein
MATPKEIAEWMVSQLEDEDELPQQKTVAKIKKLFGAKFVHKDPQGYLAIDRKVLYQFRKLTESTVVWVARPDNRLEGYWRKRDPNDSPGRTQPYWV